jgi:hypothetical protein
MNLWFRLGRAVVLVCTDLPLASDQPACALMSDLFGIHNLSHGLQEWAVCCTALDQGRIMLVVRKGGIHERGGGLFAPEHQRFALLPTFLHQDATRVLPVYAGEYFSANAIDPQPGSITIRLWAEARQIWQVNALERVQALNKELLWNSDELVRRFAYRDQPWLYVVALRIHRLPSPLVIPDHPSYAGCRSWIPLQAGVATSGSRPVLDEATYASRLAGIERMLTS